MEIVDDAFLVVRTRNPNKITAEIADSAVARMDGDVATVVVPWGLKESQFLRSIGVRKAPSPIHRDYDWPGLYSPMSHQRDTAEFLSLHKRAFCFNEAGTGKTASAIWASDYLMTQGVIRRVLIVCPLSIMQAAWQQDLFKFALHRSVGVAYGSREKRKEIINGPYEYVVINFDGVAIVADDIAKAGFDLIVVDECFVAGTLVATPQGRRPIEKLEAGDSVLTSDGVKCIKKLVRNTATKLVEVKLGSGESIRCTPEHPFFTDAGWVCAKNLAGRRLISSIELSCLRAGISPRAFPSAVGYGEQPPPWVDLLKILRTEEVALSEPQQERLLQLAAGATGQAVRTEDSGASGKAVSSGESQRVQTPSSWGERYGDDSNGTVDFRGFACGLGMELPSSVGTEATRLSYELQARLRMAALEGGIRSGWGQPHSGSATSAGSEKRSEADGAWVESVSYIECPDGETVYNLEVEGTPNYFVGDHWLAHNCNAYKTVGTKRWKAMNGLLSKDRWLWMMTGTPAAQSPFDAYGLAKLCVPERVPRFGGAFKEHVMVKISQFKWVPRHDHAKKVHAALQPAIRFEKKDCLDLPEVTYVDREVELTPQQKKYYELVRKEFLVEANDERITSANAAVNLMKLLQISAGAVYSESGAVLEFDSSNRLSVVKEVIDEVSHKVLIFVPFTHAIEVLKAYLDSHHIPTEVINGDVSVTKRNEIFNRFQTKDNDDLKVLIIQPAAAAHGVTLTAANVVIWYAPVTSTEIYLQANARIDRQGQKNAMTVVHIQGSAVERKLYKMLQSRLDAHEKLIDLYRQALTE